MMVIPAGFRLPGCRDGCGASFSEVDGSAWAIGGMGVAGSGGNRGVPGSGISSGVVLVTRATEPRSE